MNDRLPGSCWHNPVWYRGYRIYLFDCFQWEYQFHHDDYDGADDAGDDRYGVAHTVEEAKREIDEIEDK